MAKRTFGNIRKLSSGRYQARYIGADDQTYTARMPDGRALTFETRGDADAYLSLRHSEIIRDAWRPPSAPKPAVVVFGDYAATWLADRPLAVRTRESYDYLLRVHINPRFAGAALTDIAPADVRSWYAALGRRTGPTARARAYALLRTVMHTAVDDELVPANPCRIKGAGRVTRKVQITPATEAELQTIVAAMPERLKLMVLLGTWCSLRFGELAELRCGDIDVTKGLVHVRRGVVTTNTGRLVKSPKSQAGQRDVAIPPHVLPAVKAHLRDHARPGRDGLLFTNRWGDELPPSSLHAAFYPARAKAGRSDLRFHDLRHTGNTLAGEAGASLADQMARMGHSTPAAALAYQHSSHARDRVIADRMSELLNGNVTPIRATAKRKRRSAS